MLKSEHIKFMPEGGHFIVGDARESVGHAAAVNAIHAGDTVRPGAKHVAAMMLDAADGDPFARVLARVYNLPMPQSGVSADDPEKPAPEAKDESAVLRERIDDAEGDKAHMQAIASEYGVSYQDRWSAKKLTDEINAEVAKRLASGNPAKV